MNFDAITTKSFVVDFTDRDGNSFWRDVDVLIPRRNSVGDAVASLIYSLNQKGYAVSCVCEPLNGFTHEQLESLLKTDPKAARCNIRYHYLNLANG